MLIDACPRARPTDEVCGIGGLLLDGLYGRSSRIEAPSGSRFPRSMCRLLCAPGPYGEASGIVGEAARGAQLRLVGLKLDVVASKHGSSSSESSFAGVMSRRLLEVCCGRQVTDEQGDQE